MNRKLLLLPLMLLLLCFSTAVWAQDDYDDILSSIEDSYNSNDVDDTESNDIDCLTDRVVSFHTDIVLGKDNHMEVTEHIRIYTKGGHLKHGFTRKLSHGSLDKSRDAPYLLMPIKVTKVLCNGKDSPYYTKELYDYYSEEMEVYVGDENIPLDEGYYDYTICYNAPGHIWQFDDYDEIDWAIEGDLGNFACESISATVTVPDGMKILEAFISSRGSENDSAYTVKDMGNGCVRFEHKDSLSRGKSMYVLVEFSKGSQAAPSFFQLWRDDVIVLGLAVVLVIFYFAIRLLYRKKKYTVEPQYVLPKEPSPALVEFILRSNPFGDYTKSLASAIISMAIKGGATLSRFSTTQYSLEKGIEDNLDVLEKYVFYNLFSTQPNANTEVDEEAFYKAHGRFKNKAFETVNKPYKDIAFKYWMVALVALGIFIYVASGLEAYRVTLYLSIVVAVVSFFAYAKEIFYNNNSEGRMIMEEILSLKKYIETIDASETRRLTPQHFEELLPYAVAFGLESNLCSCFEETLRQHDYHPRWYVQKGAANAFCSLLEDGKIAKDLSEAIKRSVKTIQNEKKKERWKRVLIMTPIYYAFNTED